jgi:uncharacterized protein (DUF3820 family)
LGVKRLNFLTPASIFKSTTSFLMDKNQQQLIKLAHTKMPFGKYEGKFLIDLPEYYVVWYNNKGFPKGELGEQLKLIYELKLNGLEELIRNIKKRYPKPH